MASPHNAHVSRSPASEGIQGGSVERQRPIADVVPQGRPLLGRSMSSTPVAAVRPQPHTVSHRTSRPPPAVAHVSPRPLDMIHEHSASQFSQRGRYSSAESQEGGAVGGVNSQSGRVSLVSLYTQPPLSPLLSPIMSPSQRDVGNVDSVRPMGIPHQSLSPRQYVPSSVGSDATNMPSASVESAPPATNRADGGEIRGEATRQKFIN